jgi:hypothetical protein
MALVLKNRVKSTTTTTGTGTITLGTAAAGYQDFSIIGDGNETYYAIKGTTEWEVGKGTYTSSGTTLSRQLVFGSSNNGALVDFAAGTKDVLCAYPAAAMPLGVPFCDDNEIGTDLSGWTAFQAALNNGVAGGTTFGNNNTNGIVTTREGRIISGTRYWGGVLAPNGTIHCVPYSGNGPSGLKLNPDGTNSSYALAYTATVSPFYVGGVLAPNGDIHFVPARAIRGQKVNSSGVVSTYSLVYTVNDAYFGGVLAPNGDIHFVPYSANRGQKISASGVVSTYSLVFTGSFAYFGGVLAPNGDIHFVPAGAPVGQKISAAGVVSTYSLINTVSGTKYSGGVLSPNGDIHFVPYGAAVGQKISAAGVVSTYSLIYTVGGNASGGVLAPNGDIHFVGYDGLVGQKISVTGVVSTYSYGPANPICAGGILLPDGTIQFIPFNSFTLKISTNPGSPLGPGVCLSSFLNKF